LGSSAFEWIDILCDAGQSWWQALPLGPTGYGNSPYQPLSSFAGNWLLISPDELIKDGLLRASDADAPQLSEAFVDYEVVVPFKRSIVATAWHNFRYGASSPLRPSYEQFCEERAHWLEDYALFAAFKARYGGASYLDWPKELIQREPEAMAQARRDLSTVIDRVRFAQFLLFHQGKRVRQYAQSKGLRLIGDLPFFVSPDSSDVWVNPELFLLDEHHRPRFVAGVPPDYFSAQGQLWGNPVYNWDAIRERKYAWYVHRVRALLEHVDAIRLDHFRGLAAAWHVPAGAPTAEIGSWVPGPGADLFDTLHRELGYLPFIAEDLGTITADVAALRDRYQIPGTRVLQFAFDGDRQNPYLPHNYSHNMVAYTGTHDNNTTRGWYETLSANQKENLWNYVGRRAGESSEAAAVLMQLAWESPAALAIAPLQDVLNLGADARMNVPGTSEGNWCWRCTEAMLSDVGFTILQDLTKAANRSSALGVAAKETLVGIAS
ncbi:MAG: 4-alpha-glucanotransferase, partial [Acidobacteriaceae bacterium]|nr:4-alpha-glucanotransferase [Acidobacteriaceae bacterium]